MLTFNTLMVNKAQPALPDFVINRYFMKFNRNKIEIVKANQE